MKNVAICYSNAGDFFQEDDGFQKGHYDFIALFGKATTAPDKNNDKYNTWRKVFKPELWTSLVSVIKAERAAGRPAVAFLRGVDVLDNKYAGVRAYKANVLFAFNDNPTAEFKDKNKEKLKATEKAAAETYQSMFKAKGLDNDFPYISFTYLSYTQDLTDLLVRNTYHNLKSSRHLEEFIKEVRKS